MSPRWKRITLAGTAGYIMYCFSESFFWTRPTEAHLWSYGTGWLLYTFLTFNLFTLINYFKVRSPGALFLAGSIYGWLIEGVIMQTMYDAFPWQISFTALAWHALITVMIGWFYVRKILYENRLLKTLRLGCGLGLFYGLWSLNAWTQAGGEITPLPEYAAFAFVSTFLLMISYVLHDHLTIETFQPSRLGIGAQAALLGSYYLIITVPVRPLSPLILLPLLALTYVALRRNRHIETRANLLVALKGQANWWNYLLLISIPTVATLCYALALRANVIAYIDIVSLIPMGIYIGTALLGVILYSLSWVSVWKSSTEDKV